MPIDISRVRILCFDIDGTLRDTDDQFVLRLVDLLRPIRFLFHGGDPLPFSRRLVMAMENPGTFLYGLPDRLNIDHHLANFTDTFFRLGVGKNTKPSPIIEGVKEMLTQLKSYYPMAVISARGQRSTQAFLDEYELTPFFECVVTAHTCHHTKPYPDPIYWVAEQMNVSPNACLMVGDTIVDIRAGKAAGAQTVGVLCGFGEESELRQAGADLILPATPDLSSLLLGNWGTSYGAKPENETKIERNS